MKNHVLRNRVIEIFSQADEINKRSGGRRFYSLTETKGHKLIEYGLYDYFRKKYVLFDCYSRDIEEHLKDMENFIRIPFKKRRS